MSRRLWGGVATMAIALTGRAVAQAPRAGADLPSGALFHPLLADPREPGFFVAYLWGRSPNLGSKLGVVGLGQTIGLVRFGHWEVAIAAGVFSQFNMASSTNDLINADYRVGLPLTYRRRAFASRFQLYHQSSHLGDEYLLHTGAQRTNLTFESAELLVSHEVGAWRAYGGGEYVFGRSPSDLKPGVVRAGLEYGRTPPPGLRRRQRTRPRFVAGLDVISVQVRAWQTAWSMVAGLEMPTSGSAWCWSVLLKAYTGPTPYGQFYRDRLSSLGVGLSFAR